MTYDAGTLDQIALPPHVGVVVPSYTTVFNDLHPQNTYSSILVKLDEIVTDVIELESNDSYPNVVNFDGNVIDPNDPQPWNALSPIEVIVVPNVIEDKLSKL